MQVTRQSGRSGVGARVGVGAVAAVQARQNLAPAPRHQALGSVGQGVSVAADALLAALSQGGEGHALGSGSSPRPFR